MLRSIQMIQGRLSGLPFHAAPGKKGENLVSESEH
jgi:hypothetical protein